MTDVHPATLDDVDEVARIAAVSFYADPVMSWAFPDDATRLSRLTFIFAGLARDMIPDRGTVHLVGDASASLWRDPDFDHGETPADRAQEAPEPMPFSDDELPRLMALGEAMMSNHPHESHWYLNVVGTVPDQQGHGLGVAVLQPVLDRCDADGARAYLESSNPLNLSFYRRLGFVDAGEIPLPDGPSLIPMWRDPR